MNEKFPKVGRPRNQITQADVKLVLSYDPETGHFRRIKRYHRECGWINTNVEAGSPNLYGYLTICIFGLSYGAHRLAWLYMTGEWPTKQIDHINHNPSDNRWANLRDVSNRENKLNIQSSGRNKTGVVGVWWSKRRKKWESEIKTETERRWLGYFESFEDAVKARKDAETELGYHPTYGNNPTVRGYRAKRNAALTQLLEQSHD